jgi:hypothetical protein
MPESQFARRSQAPASPGRAALPQEVPSRSSGLIPFPPMGGRTRLGVAAILVISVFATGCLPPIAMPPTRGYGAPYQGTGKAIFTKDSRTDWEIFEGEQKITSEQALEATGDQEYETRRQIAKAHNELLLREAKRNRKRAKMMMWGGVGAILFGIIATPILASALKSETLTPATAMEPEMRVTEPSGASVLVSLLGSVIGTGGIAGIAYGFYGGTRKPPYYEWHTPRALDRPAYVRQQTEPYNEKLGASAPDESGPADDLGLAPGQRKPRPVRPMGGRK